MGVWLPSIWVTLLSGDTVVPGPQAACSSSVTVDQHALSIDIAGKYMPHSGGVECLQCDYHSGKVCE